MDYENSEFALALEAASRTQAVAALNPPLSARVEPVRLDQDLAGYVERLAIRNPV